MKFWLVSLYVIALANCRHVSSSFSKDRIQFPQEWHLWKGQHKKTYNDMREELGKHLVWLSNQEYIKQHNRYSDVFGYKLEMNQFGDLASRYS